MLKKFELYLIGKGYSHTTPSGNPSTVYDYQKRLQHVCKWEGITLNELATKINEFVFDYDSTGEKSYLGDKSHRAVINALKQFQLFLKNNGG